MLLGVGMGWEGYTPFRTPKPVAGGEEVAGVRVLYCQWYPYVVSSPLACRGYETPLPWHYAACGVL